MVSKAHKGYKPTIFFLMPIGCYAKGSSVRDSKRHTDSRTQCKVSILKSCSVRAASCKVLFVSCWVLSSSISAGEMGLNEMLHLFTPSQEQHSLERLFFL